MVRAELVINKKTAAFGAASYVANAARFKQELRKIG